MYIIQYILKIGVNSPFYPHWLLTKVWNKEDKKVKELLQGRILEIGAGTGARKETFCKNNTKIKEYIATDHSSWDEEFSNISKNANNPLWSLLFGYQKRIKIDKVCDATKLPFDKNSFDFHISFQVLEHIGNPFKYFEEATRVVKPKGYIIVSVPFIYRIHGFEPDHFMDYFRYAPGFYNEVAKINNLTLEKIYTYGGVGTSVALLINQWLIRKIFETKNILLKLIILVFSIPTFFICNILGALLDITPDKRFAPNLLVILRKK